MGRSNRNHRFAAPPRSAGAARRGIGWGLSCLVVAWLVPAGFFAAGAAAGQAAPAPAEELRALTAELESPDPARRMRAADQLAALGAAAAPAAPALVRLLAEADVGRQRMSRALIVSPSTKAADALERMGDAAVDAVAAALDDPDATVRGNAVHVLGRLGAGRAVDALLRAAKHAEPAVRAYAATVLATKPERRARQAVLAALADADAGVRKAAARAGPFLADALRREKPEFLNSESNTIAQALVKALSDDEDTVRSYAAWSLRYLGNTNAVPGLCGALRDRSPAVRREAAQALGALRDRRSAWPLVEAAGDGDEGVRGNVAAALGEVGDTVATTTLLELLRDPVKNVRLGAARALGQVGDRRAAPALSKMLEDGDGRAVQIAAEALGRIADPASLGALVKAARARPAEAKAIADALGELRDPAAIDVLAEMLRTRPDAAAPALAKIRHPRVVLVLGDFLAEQRPSPQKPWPNDVAWVLNGLTGRRFEFDSENFQRWWKENRGRYERAASEPAAP